MFEKLISQTKNLIPAKAGIHGFMRLWIPTFVGMGWWFGHYFKCHTYKAIFFRKPVSTLLLSLFLLLAGMAPLFAGLPPVREEPELNYVSVLHALLRLEKFKPDNQEYLDAYSMVAHCDVVSGSFNDEFRWKQAREALRKWIAQQKNKRPLRLAIKSKIMFARFDFESKYFLFSENTQLQKVNTFVTDNRTVLKACDKPVAHMLPLRFQVVTNNPITLPGLHLSEQEAKDLADKFQQVGNKYRIAYIRFNIDIQDADYIGPSIYRAQPRGDQIWRVKATLNSIEFFSDSRYKNRFYYYVPL